MARGVMVLVGTKKGVFLYRSGLSRERWRLDGSHFPGETVYHVAFDPRDGASLYSGINMSWGGPRVEVSRDLGKTWKTGKNPAFPADSELTFQRTWHIEPGHPSQPNVMWAGVEPAALFRSDDRGETWVSVKALNEHPERMQWTPGGGGLGLHSIAIDPADQGTAAGAEGERSRPLRASPRRASGRAGRALPAEPRGCVFPRRRRGRLDRGDEGSAVGLRLRRGDPSARSEDGLPLPARGPDADVAGERRWRVSHARSRQDVDEARERSTPRRALRGDARGHGDRSARSGRRVLRHDERRAVGERGRRPELGAHRPTPPGDPVRRDGDAVADSAGRRPCIGGRRPRAAKQRAQRYVPFPPFWASLM